MFCETSGLHTAIFAELMAFIISVEISLHVNCFPMWFESNSKVLVLKVTSLSMDMPRR